MAAQPIQVIELDSPLINLLEKLIEQTIEDAKTEDDENYEGWYCMSVMPGKCSRCGKVTAYLEPPDFHLIVVFEDKDDPSLLRFASLGKGVGLDPRIETYHPMLGHCIAWNDVKEYYGIT